MVSERRLSVLPTGLRGEWPSTNDMVHATICGRDIVKIMTSLWLSLSQVQTQDNYPKTFFYEKRNIFYPVPEVAICFSSPIKAASVHLPRGAVKACC